MIRAAFEVEPPGSAEAPAGNRRFGSSGAVLAPLTRLCVGDLVLAGAFGGKLFDTDEVVALLGPKAYGCPGGLDAAVREAVEAVEAVSR